MKPTCATLQSNRHQEIKISNTSNPSVNNYEITNHNNRKQTSTNFPNNDNITILNDHATIPQHYNQNMSLESFFGGTQQVANFKLKIGPQNFYVLTLNS